jgi:hypothetical protein
LIFLESYVQLHSVPDIENGIRVLLVAGEPYKGGALCGDFSTIQDVFAHDLTSFCLGI